MKKFALGIDIGGSGIKGAIVDLKTGEFATDRLRIPTPQPATPQAVADVVKEIVDSFAAQLDDGPIGITVPAIVTHGVTRSAANIDPAWVEGKRRIGVTAGASAPEVLVEEVIARLKELSGSSVRNLDGVPERVTFPLPKELQEVR